jgi:hypothetical protein
VNSVRNDGPELVEPIDLSAIPIEPLATGLFD